MDCFGGIMLYYNVTVFNAILFYASTPGFTDTDPVLGPVGIIRGHVYPADLPDYHGPDKGRGKPAYADRQG